MTTGRGAALGLTTLLLLAGWGFTAMKEREAARIRDYANLMTDTHARAIAIFNDLRAQSAAADEALRSGYIDADEVDKTAKVMHDVARKTKEEMEKFALVVPPAGAEALREEAIRYLEVRADIADLNGQLYEEIAKEIRGQGSRDKSTEIARKTHAKVKENDDLARRIRELKDGLVVP